MSTEHQPPVNHRLHPLSDGDGWVVCDQGHRHWGRHGAAGLLPYRVATRADASDAGAAGVEVLLQLRAEWSHHGGTWGILGGARNSSERAAEAALREANEEAGLSGPVSIDGQHDDDHGRWGYTTILAEAGRDLRAAPASPETVDVSWWRAEEVAGLGLHPGLAASWPKLIGALAPWHVVVDAANVIGARPDGWWRDRRGAVQRLLARCAVLARMGLTRIDMADVRPDEVLARRWPRWTVVVEGAARGVEPVAGVDVVHAPGSGDDALVARVEALRGAPTLVVTADRLLRERCRVAGASSVGPRWLLDLLPSDGDRSGRGEQQR